MTTTQDRLVDAMTRQAQEHGTVLPSGETVARRFYESELLRDLRSRGGRRDAPVSGQVAVLRAHELADLLRSRASIDSNILTLDGSNGTTSAYTAAEGARTTTTVPRLSRVPDYVTVVPSDTDYVVSVEEGSRVTAVGGTDYGFSLPQSTTFSVNPVGLALRPYGTFGIVPRNALTDRSSADTVVTDILRATFTRGLEASILTGDGTANNGAHNLLGITGTPGVVSTARGSGTRMDAIVNAISAIQTAEFMDTPPTICITPADLLTKLGRDKDANGQVEKVTDELVGQPVNWVVTNALPVGTVVVGDFSFIKLFIRGNVAIEASEQHADFFTRSMVALKIHADLVLRVTQAGAFQVITGF